MKLINKLLGWTPCDEGLPPVGNTVRIKCKKRTSIGYISPMNGKWQDLAANAMTADFDKGIKVEYWKKEK